MRKVLQNNGKKNIGEKVVSECGANYYDEEQLRNIYRSSAMVVCTEDVKPDAMRDLAKVINPSLTLDSDTLIRSCLEIYREEKAKIQNVIESFDGQVCLSLDILRDPEEYDFRGGTGDILSRYGCYVCVRVHYVDENWKLRNRVIQYDRIEVRWPQDVIKKCFQDFALENRMFVFMVHDTFDEDDDEPRIIDTLNSKIAGKEKPKISGPIFRVHCCASVFRAMVEEAFGEIVDIISMMRELYSFGKSLPTWNVKLDQIESTLKMNELGEYDSDDVRKSYKVPSDEEWKRATDVVRLVGMVKKAAEVFYESKYATASVYLINLQKLRAALIKESVSSDQFVSRMALNMLEKLYKYWKDSFMILAFATLLDPRCKLKYVEFVLLKYEGDAAHSQIQLVRDGFHNLFNEYNTMYPSAGFQEVDSSSSDADSEEEDNLTEKEKEIRDNPSFGFDSLDEYNHFLQSNSRPHRSELELYLEEQVLPWDRNINLLSYWRTASIKYPTLGRIARDILAIPLSLATDYDAYFTDFRPADSTVIRLKPNLRNALMCTRSWINIKRVAPEAE